MEKEKEIIQKIKLLIEKYHPNQYFKLAMSPGSIDFYVKEAWNAASWMSYHFDSQDKDITVSSRGRNFIIDDGVYDYTEFENGLDLILAEGS